jgi:proline dehydrogenase
MEMVLRNFFLFLSKNMVFSKAAKKWGLRLGADRFVAGLTINDAIHNVGELNGQGLLCTLDHLGEFVFSPEEATEATDYCVKTLDAIYESSVKCHLSLKLTQLGLDINHDLCLGNMRRILERAKKYNIFVRIDMEDFSHCQVTLDILYELSKEFDNVGTVIQAYLYRAEQDVVDLGKKRINLRLVKGAYKESLKVAFPEKQDVDENFKKIIKAHILSGSFTAVATHDEDIIQFTKDVVKEHNIPVEKFEFQLLYGIRKQTQIDLVKEGYQVRVYVPYGIDWYGYFMRRLAERPANVAFVLKGIFSK